MRRLTAAGRRYAKRIALFWCGIVSIVIGLAGLVTPFIPGLVLIVVGAGLLSRGLRESIVAFVLRRQKYLPVSEHSLQRYAALARRLDIDRE